MEPKIHHADSGHAVVSHGPLILRIIERAPTDFDDVDHVIEVFEELARHHPKVAAWMSADARPVGARAVVVSRRSAGVCSM